MRMGAFGALLGLSICFLALIGVGSKLPDSTLQVSVMLLALATWGLEHNALLRPPMDFSAGVVFPLLLGVAGLPAEATILLFAAVFLRQLDGKSSYPWDLIGLLPGLIAAIIVWLMDKPTLYWGVIVVLAAAVSLHATSVSSRRTVAGQENWLARATEKQLSLGRIVLLPLALLGVLVPLESLWVTVLIAPALLLVTRFGGDLGYRLEAMAGQRAREEAAESRLNLEDAQMKLKSLSEKQQLMERLVTVFKKKLGPREAFAELRKITGSVIPYDSLFFLRVDGGKTVRVQDHFCVGYRWDPTEQLSLESEPLLAKSWVNDRAIKGKSGRGLVPSDNHVVVIPLKPLGMLYFGRKDEPFSKEEAGRLRFVTERAEGGLKRAQERAEFSQALAEEKKVSKQLAHQVTLSSHLLTAAQKILGAGSERAVYDTLAVSVQEGLEHQWGAVLTRGKTEAVASWGRVPPLSELDRAHFLSPDVTDAVRRIGGEIVSAYPVAGEAESIGALLIGRSPIKGLSGEEEDFLATMALLVGGGLEALRLNQKLKEAHQQVLQASKLSAIGRLAAGVAHELNSPLAAIGLAIESAMIRPEKAGEKLERASSALERARKIVSDLLQHSRTTGSKRQVVLLGEIFAGLLNLVEAQLSRRRVKLVKSCQDPNVGVLANKDELDQVLINLILNAADASENGQEIEVTARAEDLKVVIEVVDHGSGIPEEDASRVFDPFFTTKSVGRGTGLGLSVCRELVIRHQGNISFETEEGKGTTFRLTFPRQDKWS
jgi:signal transduction histidine kinase